MARRRLLVAAGAFLALSAVPLAILLLTETPSCDSGRQDCSAVLRWAALRNAVPAAGQGLLGAGVLALGIALMGTPPRAFRPVVLLLGGAAGAYAASAVVLRIGDRLVPTANGDMVQGGPHFDTASMALLALAFGLAFGAIVLAFVMQAREKPARPGTAAR